jgi:hypothetical protein
VKNTKPVEYSRNSKIWAVGEIIEVDQNEADSLHKEGFLVMDEDDMADQKEKSETVLNPDE